MTIAQPSLIQTPWATNGDTIAIPVASDPNGFVSFNQGYTEDYEINLLSGDPQAKAVERRVQNMLFQTLTQNTQWWQGYGLAPWFSSFPGGYDQNATVMRQNGSGVWQPYRSLVTANVSDPLTTPSQWLYVQSTAELISNIPMPAGGSNGSSAAIISAATPINGMTTPGTFEYLSDAVAQGSNAPARSGSSAVAGMLEVMSWSNSGTVVAILQRYLDRNGQIYSRSQSGGTWGAWSVYGSLQDVQGGQTNYALDTGTQNAMVAAFNPPLSSRKDGQVIFVKPKFTNSAAATINDGVGTAQILGTGGWGLSGGEYLAAGNLCLQWNTATGSYIMLATSGAYQLGAGSYQIIPPSIGDQSTKLASMQNVYQSRGSIAVVNVAGNTSVVLTAAQMGAGIVMLVGQLTGSIFVNLPAQSNQLIVANNTTGNFSITMAVQGQSGARPVVPQTQSVILYTDAVNVILAGSASQQSFTRYSFTATAGQGKTGSPFSCPYTPGSILVLVNGVSLDVSDISATDGANITFPAYNYGNGCNAGEDVQVIAFASFQVANAVTWLGGAMSGPLQLYGGDTAQTPPQFDATTKIVNAQFVKTAGMLMNTFVSYLASATLTATDCGKAIQVQPSATGVVITLPLASTVPSGGMVCLKNTSGTYAFTAQRQGTDGISEGNGTSIVVNPLDDLLFVSNGVNSWYPFMGLARLPTYSGFANSKGLPGWQKLPNGMILMWGSYLSSSTTDVVVTFPIAFPNTPLALVTSQQYTSGTGVTGYSAGAPISISQAVFRANLSNQGCTYYVVGY